MYVTQSHHDTYRCITIVDVDMDHMRHGELMASVGLAKNDMGRVVRLKKEVKQATMI